MFPEKMEERIHTKYYNNSIYHTFMHSNLLQLEVFSLCCYLAEVIPDMPNMFFNLKSSLSVLFWQPEQISWVLCFVNLKCIINTQITTSCKYSQILWDNGCGLYIKSLFCSQRVSWKYSIIIILSSGKVTLARYENSCYDCLFISIICRGRAFNFTWDTIKN